MPNNKNRPYFYMVTNYEEQYADLYIFGDIASEQGGLSGLLAPSSDVSSESIARQINNVPEDYNIVVHINSNGGEVGEGLAIYNTLKSRGNVTTICEGIAASAGSIIFAAGSTRIMQPASLLFVHQALITMTGNADEMEKMAGDLRTITDTIVNAYIESGVNLKREDLMNLLRAETWITPENAVQMGFATQIEDTETDDDGIAMNSAMNSIMKAVTAVPAVLDSTKENETEMYPTLLTLAAKAEQILNSNPEILTKLDKFLDLHNEKTVAGKSAGESSAKRGFFNFKRESEKED